MGLQTLYDTPSWEWPQGAEELILRVLRDNGADKSDRLLAAEMAGDSVVVNDELADVLLSVLADGKAPDASLPFPSLPFPTQPNPTQPNPTQT